MPTSSSWNYLRATGRGVRPGLKWLCTASLFWPFLAGAQGQWNTFNGNLSAQKYSALEAITPENVGSLEKAWELHTGDVADGSGDLPKTVWSATPLFANDTVYIGTPFYRILALEPDTGKIKWSYDPETVLEALTQPALKNRGVAYWEAAEPSGDESCQKRVYIGTMDAHLHAVDADTGKPCKEFAENGVLDVNSWNELPEAWPLSLLQPPTVFEDKLFLGWAGKDWARKNAPDGTVFALDARTGERLWTFDAIPKEMREQTGTANVWSSMSVDEENRLLFIPLSSPSPNYFGGDRPGEIPYGTSVTALNVDTGEVEWTFQHVNHDIWDYDTPAAPTLVDIQRDDKNVPLLVQPTKQGFLFVLNRKTGKPVFPVEEREVPASPVTGEQAAGTQPFAMTPPPTNDPEDWPGVYWLSNLVSFGGCGRRAEAYRYDGIYTPPSEQGTLTYPPTSGGMQWGGGAVDPERGIFYVNSSRLVQIFTLIPREEYEKLATTDSGAEQGYYPQKGSPYAFRLQNFVNWAGMPCWEPPYGEISAYDLADGSLLYRRPFGNVKRYGVTMPDSWGSPTIGGPAVTAGGLIFIGASIDGEVRALDAGSGEELWNAPVDAPVVSIPAVYEYEGTQYVSFVAGGNPIVAPEVSDQIVTYALPSANEGQ